MDDDTLLTVTEAALLKGVSPATIYAAVKDGRLPHAVVLNRIALRRQDLLRYTPTRYGGREGGKGRGGRPPGRPMSDEAKERVSAAMRRNWAARKGAGG